LSLALLARGRTYAPEHHARALHPKRVDPSQRGGGDMEILKIVWEPLSLPALLVAVGGVIYQLAPIFSKRANKLRVRLERAKAKRNR